MTALTRLVWALAYTGMIALERQFILAPEVLGGSESIRVWLAVAPACVVGLLLGHLAASRSVLLRTLGYGCATAGLLVSFLAFRYFGYFGSYPGAGAFYYLSSLDTLAPSVSSNVSAASVAAAVGFGVAVLALIQWLGGRLDLAGAGPAWMRKAAGVLLVVMLGLSGAGMVVDRLKAGADEPLQDPLSWIVASNLRRALERPPQDMPDARYFLAFQQLLGHQKPHAALAPDAPLCGQPVRQVAANGRSVILVILESVSTRHLDMRAGGEFLMPGLRSIAAKEGSLSFTRHYAVGTKSNQALTAMLSGLPPPVDSHILWQKPLPRTNSLIRQLHGSGYRTVYLHGSDLSFEQQRVYLRQSGFDEIYEPGPEKPHDIIGWGYDDRVMFGELRRWIVTHRERHGGQAYFGALATLSSHDPYFVPESWTPQISGKLSGPEFRADWSGLWREDHRARELESFRFLDRQLREFYDWYEREEKPQGTLLVLVGDHAPISIYGDSEQPVTNRYGVPLIIAGENLPGPGSQFANRLASQFDIHRTLAGLVGLKSGACDQGLDLLMPAQHWPQDRMVYAVEGDFHEIAVFSSDWAGSVDRVTGEIMVQAAGPAAQTHGIVPDAPAAEPRLKGFLNTLFPVSRYLTAHRAFAPQAAGRVVSRPPLIRGDALPILVSHRGNSRGLSPKTHLPENSRAALRRARSDGFRWAEIDIQLTRDGVPVLHHDAAVTSEAASIRIGDLTLEELKGLPCCGELLTLERAIEEFSGSLGLLVELKPQAYIWQSLVLEEEVAGMVREAPADANFIVDSFSEKTVTAVKRTCGCEAGLDAPQNITIDRPWLQHVVNLGLDWVYVEKSQVSAALIRMAHGMGLKVMVYTVNAVADLARWGDQWPDGILTDDGRIRRAVQAHFRNAGPQAFAVQSAAAEGEH